MAAKKTATSSATAIPGSGGATPARSSTPTPATMTAKASKSSGSSPNDMVQKVIKYYINTTGPRTNLIDVFLVFLVVNGAVQFLYCIIAGNYPFNAFLAGFCATVGQFVLTASLRIQTQEANKNDFPSVSPERAFADYVVCSLILHFFCVNFIN
ncbi:oligosaccharyl transferase subunit [Zalerion maritima]|uniref:Dolichyl-diphosphooligosaccharide--protein glycosyltransferase subunit OST2 n=1 Tax=Zalerion maritima TaxID=339359 RepID=A0AAD5WRN4_9PEZI|nr:oligosaccharyl transferase subunit [Zalerion maritima]